MPVTDEFYAQMAGYQDFEQFTQREFYQALPGDWFVVITDIKASTAAIEAGKYKAVNAVSTASIIAVLNVFPDLQIPYVFGGDGATLCVPPSRLDAVKAALVSSRELAETGFDLTLRVGLVPVAEIERQGYQIWLAKYQPSRHFVQAMFQGDGLAYAEDLVKQTRPNNPYILEDNITPSANYDGFECRWDEIPGSQEETVALMIKSLELPTAENQTIYAEIFKTINQIYGDENLSHPLRVENLSLTLAPGKLGIETRIRTFSKGTSYIRYLLKLLFLSVAGKYLMARKVTTAETHWGDYKTHFITNTDYRKFDETLRIIICGNEQQRTRLTEYLTSLYLEKKIVFGIHTSTSSIVTCMVRNYDKQHSHFLDVSNGGYAMAAKQMKQQLAELKANKLSS